MSVTKSEYRDLQRRYMGPDWPEGEETVDLHVLSQRMGVPLEEVVQDLKQLREQVASVPNTLAAHEGYTDEPRISGKRGILTFVIMITFCMILFVVLMTSIKWFVPNDRNLSAPVEKERSGELLVQPK